jgi:hypothetical protein
MVAAGAAEGAGARVYSEIVMETAISGFRFDEDKEGKFLF